MNRFPPPWPFSVRTTFQAFLLFGSVLITAIVSSPRWPVAQTAPYFGSFQFAPRPGCGILPTSTNLTSLSSLASITAILCDWLAATRK